MSEPRFSVMNPRGYRNNISLIPLSPRPADLNGKTVYMIESWPANSGFDVLLPRVRGYLTEKYPRVRIVQVKKPHVYSQDDPELWAEIEQQADAFVYFSGPSCSTTSFAVTWPALLESRGVPGLSVVYEYLLEDVKIAIEREGAQVRYALVPYPCDSNPEEKIREILRQILTGLTSPLSGTEQQTGLFCPEPPPKLAFEGTEAEIQDYFYEMGWTDGLPVTPPTPERVTHMLTGTSHAAEETVSCSMAPELWRATVEKVAVNAVMAGAKPEYMPVLLAAAELLGGDEPPFSATAKSTNSFSFMQVVNGPIRREIGMNAGTYALGAGNRANAVIGRALRLFLINLGGSKVDVNLMGVQGNNGSYTFAFAENEEHSPWPSLAEDRGFQPGESTISIFTGGWAHLGNYFDGDLDMLCESASYFEPVSGLVVLMSPRKAKALAAEGYSKAEVIDYIWRKTALPLEKFQQKRYFSHYIRAEEQDKGKQWTEEFLKKPGTAMVPVFPQRQIHLVVVGDEKGTPMMQGWHMAKPAIASVDKWR